MLAEEGEDVSLSDASFLAPSHSWPKYLSFQAEKCILLPEELKELGSFGLTLGAEKEGELAGLEEKRHWRAASVFFLLFASSI